jgi:hypothetical protein
MAASIGKGLRPANTGHVLANLAIQGHTAPWTNGSSSICHSAKPPEPGNWMLELLLAGQGFTAEGASFDIQEAGMTLEFKELAKANV